VIGAMATPDRPTPGLPPGLPDPAALARMATEFFAALPSAPASGGVPLPVNPHPAGFSLPPGASGPATPSAVPLGAIPPSTNLLPTSPQAPANAGASAPALLPHAQAPNGMPDVALVAAPGYEGRAGAYALGVPEAYAAALPLPAPTPPGGHDASIPSTPGGGPEYYFLSEPVARSAWIANPEPPTQSPIGVPQEAPTSAPGYDARAGGQALGVPEAYAAALPLPASSPLGGGASSGPSTPGGGPEYYFLAEPVGRSGTVPVPEPTVRDERVGAPRYGLPGAGALRDPPRADALAPGAAPGPATAAPSYYFIDTIPASAPAPVGAGIPLVAGPAHPPFDVNAVRRDFPILAERVNGRPLVWFDNAATTQKPQSVIDRLAYFYAHENSNIHRAAHELAARATDAYEKARETVRRFLGASSAEEIIFVRGTTEAINLVAKSWGTKHVGPGDEIIVSHLEHHANIVPWQQLAGEKGARLRVIPVDDSGQVLLEEYQRLLNDRTKIVAVAQVSNALGTVVPVKEIVDLAHRAGAKALIDGAQSVSHMRVDMRSLDADFFVFSGHKIFGPTGIGVVYGKRELLEVMPPWQGGGNMITDVTFERTLYQGPPARFEAGTGNIADAVGLGTALEYVQRVGIENIARYEHALLEYATLHMQSIDGVRLIGTARDKASVLSFVLNGASTEEVGKALNEEGIAVRAGHHCAQPILRRFGLESTVRPSLAFYNTCEEVDRMVAVVRALANSRR
jgi:cysteine desulfurase/selenocysteine lyase